MWPVLFEYGDGAVTSYSFLVGIGFLVALWIWYREGQKVGIPGEKIVNMGLVGLVVGFVGARLLFIITEWPDFARGTYRVWAVWEGGVVYYGGFLAGAAYLLWAFRRNQVNLEDGLNSIVPALAFGHAFGRIGCFLNGCCYGGQCDLPWAVSYTSPLTIAPKNIPLHPVQLYEALGLFMLGFILLRANSLARAGKSIPGVSTWMFYFLLYPPMRFVLEFFRDDPERGSAFGLSTSQWISIALFFACVFVAFLRLKRHNCAHVKRT